MADLAHTWGSDLSLSSSGDLLLVEGSAAGRARVLRRLLSNPQDLIYHLDYGAGLPQQVGQNTNAVALESVVRIQMLEEAVVQQEPPPDVAVTALFGGATIRISYTDDETGNPVALGFTVEG